MPTLFRLVFVFGVVAAAGYGALYGLATLVKPQERSIVQAISLPRSAAEVHIGRSVAEVLNHQAAALAPRRKHSTR